MIKELTSGKAVVLDNGGKVLRQLSIRDDVQKFITKREAELFAKKQGLPKNRVQRFIGRFGFKYWAIRWDYRFPYFLACWDVE